MNIHLIKHMDSEILSRIKFLNEMIDIHPKEAKLLLDAAGKKIIILDMIAIPIYNRSMSLISGFVNMIEQNNFICATPLIRLQIDNYLRFYASSLVEDSSDFTLRILDGEKVSNFKDFRTGKNLKDWYLLQEASKACPWLKGVYDATSGYIHLSSKHVFNAIKNDSEPMKIQMKVGKEDSYIPTGFKLEAVNAMIEITKLVLTSLRDWRNHKNSHYTKL